MRLLASADTAGLCDPDAAGPRTPGDRADLHHIAGLRGVDHLAVADVHAHVVQVGVEEHQVTRLELLPGDVDAGVELTAGVVRQVDADLRVGVHGQPGTVEALDVRTLGDTVRRAVRPAAAPGVGS